MFFKKKNEPKAPKKKMLSVMNIESKKIRIAFTISSVIFGLTLLMAMVSTMKSQTNWVLWAVSLIFGCISAAIFIFNSKKD